MSEASARTPEIVVRPATTADVPDILEIERESFLHAGERFGERRIRSLLRSPRTIVLAAASDGRVIGWAAGFAWTRGREPWGRIYALAVHPGARGRKLGPRLLEEMIDRLIAAGGRHLFLEVRPDNLAAIRLYERFGFQPCRDLHGYYGPGIPARRMRRAGRITEPSPGASP